jgi:hypothetical protein
MRTVEINREPVELYKILKFEGLTSSGGEAKLLIGESTNKVLYAGILKASERWTHPIKNWNLTLSQLTIHFPGRLDNYISL